MSRDVLTLEQLDAAAAWAPAPTTTTTTTPTAGANGSGSLVAFCGAHGIGIGPGELRPDGATRYRLEAGCPFDPSHTDAAVFELPDGVRGFHCFRKSCSAYTWRDFRARLVPDGDRQSVTADEPGTAPDPAPWPVLDGAALYGLAGDVVRTIAPHTEADPVALLVQFLTAFGNAVGSAPHYFVESTRHPGRLFVVMCGQTSKGRKGTSWAHVRRLMRLADPDWVDSHVTSGLSSGEGLLWAVRDPVTAKHPVKERGRVTGYEEVIEDHGVNDKRLLVVESEFASPIRRMARDGNSLSALMRESWDTGDLKVMTTGRQKSPVQATDASVSIVAHTTRDEVLRVLDRTEYGNGFANRFLWCGVRRSNELPHGGNLDDADLAPLGRRTRQAIESASRRGRLRFDMEADAVWCAGYRKLAAGEPGLIGAIAGRAEAQTLRLALLYALLDEADEIRLPHLTAALALWRYCHASVRYIFGDSLGDPIADSLLAALRDAGSDGLALTDMHNVMRRHASAEAIARALRSIEELGRARRVTVPTAGRPATRYVYAVAKEADKAKEVPAIGPEPDLNSLHTLYSHIGNTHTDESEPDLCSFDHASIDPLRCSTCDRFDCAGHGR